MSRQRDREEFIAVVCREAKADLSMSEKIEKARYLMRCAATLKTIAERLCNEEMSDRETARVDAKEANTEARAQAVAESLGFKAIFSGDPRGYVFKVILPSAAYNTWGGAESGWGVP